MRLTGEVGKAFQRYGVVADGREIMAYDAYAIIDMCAAIEMNDRCVQFQIASRVKLLIESCRADGVTIYNGFVSPPARLVKQHIDGKALIDYGEYRSTYTRRWELYSDGIVTIEVLAHRHDGQGAYGTEYWVWLFPCRGVEDD